MPERPAAPGPLSSGSGTPASAGASPSRDAEPPHLKPPGGWWSFVRDVAHMSRSTAVMLIVFLVVVLLYLWVREEPFVRIGPPEPDTGSGTGSTSQVVEPTETTGAREPTAVEPTGPTGSEVAVPERTGADESSRPEPTETPGGQEGATGTVTGGDPDGAGAGQQGPATVEGNPGGTRYGGVVVPGEATGEPTG